MNVSETNRISFIDKSVKLRKVKDVGELNELIAQCREQNKPFSVCDLSDVDLKNLNMTCLDIENVIFNTFDVKKSEYKQIYNVCFKGARLRNVSFAQCQLVRCNFDKWELTLKEQEKLSLELRINAGQKRETYLEEVDFFFCRFEACRFRKTNIKIADFRYSKFIDCSLGGSCIGLGDFYMAAFSGTTNFTDCLWSHCSITNATFENHCLRIKSINKLAQECYKDYSEIIIGHKRWLKQNPCADFSHQNDDEDKNRKTKSQAYIHQEASEVYALLSGFYAGKGLFRDSNFAYERAKRNEALKHYFTLNDALINMRMNLYKNVGNICKSLAGLFYFLLCWIMGFGYKITNVLICFILLVIGYSFVFHIKKDDYMILYNGAGCSLDNSIGGLKKIEDSMAWYNELAYSLNNSMGPFERFIEIVGCWLSSLQTTAGLLLIGFAGFIIANRIRNNY